MTDRSTVVTGELIRMMNYVDDIAATLRRITAAEWTFSYLALTISTLIWVMGNSDNPVLVVGAGPGHPGLRR